MPVLLPIATLPLSLSLCLSHQPISKDGLIISSGDFYVCMCVNGGQLRINTCDKVHGSDLGTQSPSGMSGQQGWIKGILPLGSVSASYPCNRAEKKQSKVTSPMQELVNPI